MRSSQPRVERVAAHGVPPEPDTLHRLKNQLGVVLGCCELLIENEPPNQPHRADLLMIQAAAREALALVPKVADNPEGALDVTGRTDAESHVRDGERRYRALVENSQGLICSHDLDGRILTVNPAALRQLGYDGDDLPPMHLRDLLSPDTREHLPQYLERMRYRGEDTGLMIVRAKDGQERTWQYHNVTVNEPGRPPYVLGHAQDVTSLRQMLDQLKKLSSTDELTGLLNRRAFFARGTRLLARSEPSRQEFTVVYVDLDGLKAVNDTYGHDVGSALLVAAADVLKHTFRAADLIGRIGGDEFVALAALPPQAASIILERLRYHVDRVNARSTLPCRLAMSIGMAHMTPGMTTTLDELVRAADEQMYTCKKTRPR